MRLFHVFGVGAAGGVAAVMLHWLVVSTQVNIPFLSFTPSVTAVYAAAFWGGVCGALFLSRIPSHWAVRGVLFALVPAVVQQLHGYTSFKSGLMPLFEPLLSQSFWQMVLFQQKSWVWLGCYVLVWLVLSFLLSKNHL